MKNVRAERLAQKFHEAYERLAPAYGYRTREAPAVPWKKVPEPNRSLLIAVCAELLADGDRALDSVLDSVIRTLDGIVDTLTPAAEGDAQPPQEAP